jgi:class 3 adenylate cyclase
MEGAPNILVAEDEKIIAKDICQTLARFGYNVCDSATSVEKIIAKAKEVKPDLVLMDILLNGEKTGIDAASIVQGEMDIPVIYLTALADEDTINRAKKTEPYGYILKPFDEKTLRSSVEMALYKHQLNMKLKKRTLELEEEKVKSDNLLHNIFPNEVVNELKTKGIIEPKEYKLVTLLFTDFQGFTRLASQMSANSLVEELNDIFNNFDLIVEKNGVEKLKTIGDSYMLGAGFPNETKDHAVKIINTAFEMLDYLTKRNAATKYKWEMRIGAHSGNVVAGVVGKRKYSYDVWGETVNIANRLESNSLPGKISISGQTYELVKNYFECKLMGHVKVSDKIVDNYFVMKRR